MYKGKYIKWDWEIEKNLNNPTLGIKFWIEDLEGNKNCEIENYKDKGSFVVPSNGEWNLRWENPFCMEDSSSSNLELTYKVEIVNQPPIASVKVDETSGSAPLTISFTGSGLDYDGEITSYHWDFSDKSISNTQNPKYTFSNVGEYNVTLIITDDCGATAEDSVIITVYE